MIADLKRLYELIWKRTMASQMADAELEKTIAKISISTNKEELTAQGEVLKFDGFLKVYREDVDDDDWMQKTNTGRNVTAINSWSAIAAERNEGN